MRRPNFSFLVFILCCSTFPFIGASLPVVTKIINSEKPNMAVSVSVMNIHNIIYFLGFDAK